MFTQESINQIPKFKDFVQKLFAWYQGFVISDEMLLLEAMVHKSYACDFVERKYKHNERLEFLWDGVLGAVTNKLLYIRFAGQAESKMTLSKIKLVRTETLADVSRKIGLNEITILGNGEEKQWWRDKDSVLADCLEALIGYVYLDMWIEAVEYFVSTYVYDEDLLSQDNKSAKSRLQESIQKQYKDLPIYNTVDWQIDENKNTTEYKSEIFFDNKLLGVWYGKNKKLAEEEAANNALWLS